MPFNNVSDYFKLPEYQDRARSFYAQLAHQKEAERVQDEQLKLAQADQLIRNQKAARDQEEFEREKALGENIMRYLNANQEEVPLTAPSAQPAIRQEPASTNPVPMMNPMAPGQEGAPNEVPLGASLAPNPMAPGQDGAPSAPQPDLMAYLKPHFDNGQLMAQSVAQPAAPKTAEEQLVENSKRRDIENRRIAAMLAGVNPAAAVNLLRSGGTDEARIIASQLANERAIRAAEIAAASRRDVAGIGAQGRVDAAKTALGIKGRQALNQYYAKVSAGAGNMPVYATDESGNVITDENGFPVPDPEKLAAAHEKALDFKERSSMSTALKTAKDEVEENEKAQGVKLTDQEKAAETLYRAENRGAAPKLTSKQQSDLDVSEFGLRRADQLIDEIKNAGDKVKFGPGTFRFDEASGKWFAKDPKDDQANKIAQTYNTLLSGKAFDQGGRTLTKEEIQRIITQIGDPHNADFAQRVKDFQSNELGVLATRIQQLEDNGFNNFITHKKRIERLKELYTTQMAKGAQEPNAAFPKLSQPLGGGQQAPSIASPKTQADYDALPSGSVYVDTDGKTKRKK